MKETKVYTGRRNGKYAELMQRIDKVKELEQDLEFTTKTANDLIEIKHKLEQELEEKDKEIKSLIADYEKRISQEQELMSNMEHQLTEKQNTIDEINKEAVKNQTQLAIQELEKLKASADKWFDSWENSKYEGNIYDKLDVSNAYLQMSCEIGQQIKKLKGEKDAED